MSTYHVKVYYGPCESYYTKCHKPQKLKGLRDKLRKLGFRVDLQPVEFINYCMLEMCGHEPTFQIFRCNIQYLRFNTPHQLDPVCQRAIDAVIDANVKFNRARQYLWSWLLIEDQMFKRSEYAPKEYWVCDVDLPPMSLDCIKCCGILVTDQPEVEKSEAEKKDALLKD